jgi:hypothetical protein
MNHCLTEHDVFLSYAQIDNLPASGIKQGWASSLHHDLERALSRQLGGRSEIWFDLSELRGNAAVTPEIADKLLEVQTFVAIVSQSYLNSSWCRRELSLFRERFQTPDSGRIFVANIQGLNSEQLQDIGLEDLPTYRFWYRDENKRIRTYGWPEPRSEEREYYRLVEDLATDIADVLKRDGRTPAASMLPQTCASVQRLNGRGASSKPLVLAEVTDDLGPLRQQLRRCLEQAGRTVRICDGYGISAEEFKHVLRRQLQGAAFFVQLLSQIPSRRAPGLPDGYAIFQHRCALEASLPIFQWRDPRTDLEAIEDKAHHDLLLEETVHAIPFESFKRLIASTPLDKSVPTSQPRLNPFVFINAEKRDLPLANQIKNYVGKYAAAFLPVSQGKPEEIRRDLEDNIVDCDGLLLVHGNSTAAWVHQQLRLYNKLAPRREKPIKLLAVIEAPSAKQDINVEIPGLSVVNCRSGIQQSALENVLSRLSPTQLQ